LGSQQRAGKSPVKCETLTLPANRQGPRLFAASLGQWEIGMSLEPAFKIADQFAMTRKCDVEEKGVSHWDGILPLRMILCTRKDSMINNDVRVLKDVKTGEIRPKHQYLSLILNHFCYQYRLAISGCFQYSSLDIISGEKK
jgi:hypothetical protein